MTMKQIKHTAFRSILLLAVGVSLTTAQSGRQYRRSAIMNGNEVRTVFGNWGVIGQPAELGHRGAWRNDNNGYLGDVSPMVGAEVKWDTLTFHSVVTCPVARPSAVPDQDLSTGKFWTFEPVAGYFNASGQSIAMSNNSETWPLFWPDRMTDLTDPGWRKSWNGYFGKKISADLESYFVMDDNNDERFNNASNNPRRIAFKPDTTRPLLNGLGLVMKVRAMQWGQFLAKDNIFWLYEISNTGLVDYNRVVFGMIVGTYVGVTSTEDYGEYRDDWSFYSAKDNITFTGDFGRHIDDPLWVGPVGMVGYAFLESPGNPYDGIDNDGDADSSLVGRSAPQFQSTSFDTTTITAGSQIVLIRNDFTRTLYTVPNVDSVKVYTRGLRDSIWIYPGLTKVAEGNILHRTIHDATFGNIVVDYVNTNAYDGVDNNFNGLIDENYYIHYRQVKKNRNPAGQDLINIPAVHRYANYRTGAGTQATSMIDERRDDLIDNNNDWNISKDDVGRDGIAGTHDAGESDGLPTSGYLAGGIDSGLPGEPHIDKTDVRESDQIGLTSFFYFVPANQVRLGDDESLWGNLAPGLFDVPTSIVLNQPVGGEDGDFIYGSGYFPLLEGKTERFSLALVYGGGHGGSVADDITDLLRNKATVQQIYDANYKFPKAPDHPTLTAVPGDRMITLYWDRKAEETIDEVLGTKTFEGYKILKSTTPDFSDLLTITDGRGNSQGYRPLAQYDLVDTVKGFFYAGDSLYQGNSGYSFYMGDDTGLKHSYVDVDVENGRQYYYAVIAYSKGNALKDIFPAENRDFKVTVDNTGAMSHIENVAIVTPNAPVSGYKTAPTGVALTKQPGVVGTGNVNYSVLDPAQVLSHNYQVEFFDTQNDGIDNNANGKVDAQDSTESDRVTSLYSIRDLTPTSSAFISQDTGRVTLPHGNLIAGTISVRNSSGALVAPANYSLDLTRGVISSSSPGSLPVGSYSITYQYYPVLKSPHMQRNPAIVENADADAFDGVELNFNNDWVTKPDTSSRFVGSQPYDFTFASILSAFTIPTPILVRGIAKPSDYRLEFSDNPAIDTSQQFDPAFLTPAPVNFRIRNVTDSIYVPFMFFDNDGNGVASHLDEIWFYEPDLNGRHIFTWVVTILGRPLGGTRDTATKHTGAGDTLLLFTHKPFRKADMLRFTPVIPATDVAKTKGDMQNIKVVPNPYVTAAAFEPPLPPAITSGRGTRKIEFTHVPVGATISVYTARGDHVITLKHDGNIEDGSVSWNLKSKENLDIAYGVYFFVANSPAGTKTGKFAIIK